MGKYAVDQNNWGSTREAHDGPRYEVARPCQAYGQLSLEAGRLWLLEVDHVIKVVGCGTKNNHTTSIFKTF